MAEISGIEWTDGTFNPWIGCTKVSPACDNCYAAVSTPSRTLGVEWGVGQLRHRTSAPIWYEADGMAPPEFGRYRHGRFMVRWMARIVREVTSIAVEHLSSISEADAMREGIEVRWITFWGGQHAGQAMERYYIPGLYEERQANDDVQMTGFDCASSAFFRLWEILHGPGSVEADPWLWVIGYGEVRQ